MRKLILLALLMMLGFASPSIARVGIGVNIPIPPVVAFSGPPNMVIVPGTDVYYYPYSDDLYFCEGYWYRLYAGYWYRSENYDGPWFYVESPPAIFFSLPPDFRSYGGAYIPYYEFHRHWREWDRAYWEHHNWGLPEGHHWVRREGHYDWRNSGPRYHGVAPSYGPHEGRHSAAPHAEPMAPRGGHEEQYEHRR